MQHINVTVILALVSMTFAASSYGPPSDDAYAPTMPQRGRMPMRGQRPGGYPSSQGMNGSGHGKPRSMSQGGYGGRGRSRSMSKGGYPSGNNYGSMGGRPNYGSQGGYPSGNNYGSMGGRPKGSYGRRPGGRSSSRGKYGKCSSRGRSSSRGKYGKSSSRGRRMSSSRGRSSSRGKYGKSSSRGRSSSRGKYGKSSSRGRSSSRGKYGKSSSRGRSSSRGKYGKSSSRGRKMSSSRGRSSSRGGYGKSTSRGRKGRRGGRKGRRGGYGRRHGGSSSRSRSSSRSGSSRSRSSSKGRGGRRAGRCGKQKVKRKIIGTSCDCGNSKPMPTDVSPTHGDKNAYPMTPQDAACTKEGEMKCSGQGFLTCANKKWVQRACAAGTACRPFQNSILCDHAANQNAERCTQEGQNRCSANGTGFETCAQGVWVKRACGPATKCNMVGTMPQCT